MTDLLRFQRWLGFYRPQVKLLAWQEQAARLIFAQARDGAGRSFFIRILAEYDQLVERSDSRSEQRKMDLTSE